MGGTGCVNVILFRFVLISFSAKLYSPKRKGGGMGENKPQWGLLIFFLQSDENWSYQFKPKETIFSEMGRFRFGAGAPWAVRRRRRYGRLRRPWVRRCRRSEGSGRGWSTRPGSPHRTRATFVHLPFPLPPDCPFGAGCRGSLSLPYQSVIWHRSLSHAGIIVVIYSKYRDEKLCDYSFSWSWMLGKKLDKYKLQMVRLTL